MKKNMNLRYQKRMTAFLLDFSMILTAPTQLVHAEETTSKDPAVLCPHHERGIFFVC